MSGSPLVARVPDTPPWRRPRVPTPSPCTTGGESEPVFVTAPPGDQRLFVIERPGYIQVIHNGITSQFLDIHDLVDTTGERGLALDGVRSQLREQWALLRLLQRQRGAPEPAVGDIHIDEFHVGRSERCEQGDPPPRRSATAARATTTAASLRQGRAALHLGWRGGRRANAQTLANPLGKILRINPHGGSRDPAVESVCRESHPGDLVSSDCEIPSGSPVAHPPDRGHIGDQGPRGGRLRTVLGRPRRRRELGWPSCELAGSCGRGFDGHPSWTIRTPIRGAGSPRE